MATFSTRTKRIANASETLDRALRGIEGITPDDLAKLRGTVLGKVTKDQVPATGTRFIVTDVLAGTPFAGATGKVTADRAKDESGIKFPGRRVMVRFDSAPDPSDPRRLFYPMPILALTIEQVSA